jgi:hypothetical protein
MCGIVGVGGNLFVKDEELMKRLLLLDFWRGVDSTGLLSIKNNNEVKIAKIASDPITLFQMAPFKDALNGNTSKLFLGHNRAATRGGINNFNAHPFQYEHIIATHNGTLDYKDKAALEEAVGEKFDVDSQALIAAIAKLGIKAAIELCHEGATSIDGAWSLVWYDLSDSTLNFLRNKHRPMWYAWDEGFKRIIFASEFQMIYYATSRHNAPYTLEKFEYKDKPGQFYSCMQVPEDVHLKFFIDEIKKGSKERPKPLAKVIKAKEPSRGKLYDPFGFGTKTEKVGSSQKSKTTTQPSTTTYPSSNKDNVFHLFGSGKDPYANMLAEYRFSELTQETPSKLGSCSWCWEGLEYGTPGVTVYDEQDTILCRKCGGHENTNDECLPALKLYVSPENFRKLEKKAA